MTGNFSPSACGSAGWRRGIGLRFDPPLVSLTALVWAGQVSAETTVATARTTPISTSTAASGAPDNISITADGSVKPASGVAVTLDSDNTASNAGTIQIQDVSDMTGVLVLGGHTGAVTNSNAITFNETATPVDTNGDGNLDGPFASASGGSARSAIRPPGSCPAATPPSAPTNSEARAMRRASPGRARTAPADSRSSAARRCATASASTTCG